MSASPENFGHWNFASVLWGIWLLQFMALEFWALGTGRPQDTLSDQVWRLEGTGWTFARYAVAAFLGWLFFHMVDRLFR